MTGGTMRQNVPAPRWGPYRRNMDTGPDGRKRVDISRLPFWAQAAAVAATVLLVGGLAWLVGGPDTGPVVPWSAIVAALIAFALVAWQASRR